jgi:hypothetical protein
MSKRGGIPMRWCIVITEDGNSDREYRYYGGTLVDVLVRGVAVDCINIHDYTYGKTVGNVQDLVEFIQQWLGEGPYAKD